MHRSEELPTSRQGAFEVYDAMASLRHVKVHLRYMIPWLAYEEYGTALLAAVGMKGSYVHPQYTPTILDNVGNYLEVCLKYLRRSHMRNPEKKTGALIHTPNRRHLVTRRHTHKKGPKLMETAIRSCKDQLSTCLTSTQTLLKERPIAPFKGTYIYACIYISLRGALEREPKTFLLALGSLACVPDLALSVGIGVLRSAY